MSIFSMDTKSAWNFSSKTARIPSGNSAIFASIFSRSIIRLVLSTSSNSLEMGEDEGSSSTDSWSFPFSTLLSLKNETSWSAFFFVSEGRLILESSNWAPFSSCSTKYLGLSNWGPVADFNSVFFLHRQEASPKFFV